MGGNFYMEALASIGYSYSTEVYEINVPGRAGERLLINRIAINEGTTDVATPTTMYGLQVRGTATLASATTDGLVMNNYPISETTLDVSDCLVIVTAGNDYHFVDIATVTTYDASTQVTITFETTWVDAGDAAAGDLIYYLGSTIVTTDADAIVFNTWSGDAYVPLEQIKVGDPAVLTADGMGYPMRLVASHATTGFWINGINYQYTNV